MKHPIKIPLWALAFQLSFAHSPSHLWRWSSDAVRRPVRSTKTPSETKEHHRAKECMGLAYLPDQLRWFEGSMVCHASIGKGKELVPMRSQNDSTLILFMSPLLQDIVNIMVSGFRVPISLKHTEHTSHDVAAKDIPFRSSLQGTPF